MLSPKLNLIDVEKIKTLLLCHLVDKISEKAKKCGFILSYSKLNIIKNYTKSNIQNKDKQVN